ncbi:unnamed protein product [Acanthoscelides obtectus]|uniref:Guanylate cyclase domain-containing protein n=1 Tax=Acanthoscelides obtectus TaxID=200917 RepID=A0A9P0KB59_ACAOB|nr:unnamed protein product [Acanthoscelides obtectus]CAK1672593.1 Adenylate cyclase type 10 [Acanthoscelides obtectus]
MRTGILQQDSDEWKNRRSIPISEMMQASRTYEGDKANSFAEEGLTRTMASLVPDEILYNINDYTKRDLEACLLFGDVSGFTDLCEKYNKSGKGGPSRLTQVLNSYIGAMVQEILSHNGDVLKFSGDAFIALWKETDHLSLRDAVHEAIDCALVIQKSYGTYQTDVDVVVRVKLAVAAGHLVFSLIGDDENSHYLMTGQPIYDIKAAESKSKAGEIIITARVSHHLSANEYLIDLLSDGIHAKVLGVGPNWRNIQRTYENKEGISDTYSLLSAATSLEDELRQDSGVSILHPSEKEKAAEGGEDDDLQIASRVVTDQYALRPAVNFAARMRMKEQLKRFIIAPVVRGILAEEPIEYLTEIRQVAILFINSKVSPLISNVKGIDVANEVYLAVCNTVKNQYGCVNKISNFDKDLMLLVIFGLRGFKHELESQIALKCAIEATSKIRAIEHIQEVAAGVTTGKCYCGAFGHTLRREYTVIGLTVNKGARLMVAYANKVTCDRETFLHSKLESRNFILQEYKPLKGIVNPGPIYEFREVEKTHQENLTYILPLLGREQEIDLFSTLLKRATKLSKHKTNKQFYNMIIFQGAYRQGKSRLYEELTYSIDQNTPLRKFTLTRFDYDVPYRTVRYIFRPFLGTEATSVRDREKKILRLLSDKELEDQLCFLNFVFDVKFNISKIYKDMDLATKYETLKNLFKILCMACFHTFYIIAIDDAENIDDESWMLLKLLLDLNLVFVVATMGTAKELSTLAMKVLRSTKIKTVELKGIDKWYHVGLACQMLSVDGIPAELEKTIQMKSNGNPGWVESFLVSLMQSGGLYVHEMSREAAYDAGIVMAPLYMVMRLSREEIALWVEIMEERKLEVKEDLQTTRWKMFIDSCRESYPDLSVAKTFRQILNKTDVVNICTVDEKFNLEDVDPELIIDVIILKTFDSLTSYEQLLLKCSAILGDIFPRDMLLYIMSSSAIRLTALAVQKLFEIHVLSCARGNFIEGGLTFKERLINPNEDMSVKCECKGLVVDDSCMDLPKYASCGYLRFRSSEFRITTYNLLTDNQKREFHGRAIRYLEKETRRCRACGNGYFTRQMGGGRLDNTLRYYARSGRKMDRKKSSLFTDNSSTEYGSKLMQRVSFLSYESQASSATRSTRDFRGPRDTMSMTSSVSSGEQFLTLGESFYQRATHTRELGIKTINRLKDDINLPRSFSTNDFSQCTCLLILNTMYSQLIEHCKGAGMIEKLLSATVEYAYVCLQSKNVPQAVKVLEEALAVLDGPMKEQIELDWMVELKKGKLYALLGKARMEVDDPEAYNFFMKSLKCYGVSFPKSSISRSFWKFKYKTKQNLKFWLYGNFFDGKPPDDDVAEYCNNVSECLCFLTRYFVNHDKWREAELAALWSLTKALQTETDFEKLCMSYSNLIHVSAVQGKYNFCVALEVFALKTCRKKKTCVELDELKAVAQLYFNISRSRARRGELEKYLHISYVAWRLMTSSQLETLVFVSLPFLVHMLLLRRQVTEFGNLLQEIRDLLDQDHDNSLKCWFYAMCMCLHLDTGLIAQPYAKCVKYIQGEGMEPTLRDPNGKARLIVCIWLCT